MNNFDQLSIPETLKSQLKKMGYHTPTPIQAQAIPAALEGHDIVGSAETGTGKTGAFGIPMLTYLCTNPESNALVLVPTRELAQQVEQVLAEFSRSWKLRMCTIIGGVAIGPQIRNLRQNPRIIIATPGRLNDHLQQRTCDLRQVKILVLDEADRMLDMGFFPQISRILSLMPQERQNLLFSATFPKEVESLVQKITRNPKRVNIGRVSKPAELVEQKFIETTQPQKITRLLDLLNSHTGTALIFARTKSRTDRLARQLDSYGLEVEAIHGDRSQGQRQRALRAFKEGRSRILVATDIAARGIDVSNIEIVVNYDLPDCAEDYIHRIGRSGRGGNKGVSYSFLIPEERDKWKDIHRLIRDSLTEEQRKELPQIIGSYQSKPHRSHSERAMEQRKQHNKKFWGKGRSTDSERRDDPRQGQNQNTRGNATQSRQEPLRSRDDLSQHSHSRGESRSWFHGKKAEMNNEKPARKSRYQRWQSSSAR